MATRKELINQALALVVEYEHLDQEADDREGEHNGSIEELAKANAKAAADNGQAETQLSLDEAAASTAYDEALAIAKARREDVRRAGEKLVQEATIVEQAARHIADTARENVQECFDHIEQTLREAADAKEEPLLPVNSGSIEALVLPTN